MNDTLVDDKVLYSVFDLIRKKGGRLAWNQNTWSGYGLHLQGVVFESSSLRSDLKALASFSQEQGQT